MTQRCTLGGKRFLLVHATPRDPLDEYLLKDPETWAKRLQNVDADIVCVGHSHMQFNLEVDGVVVLNPGSVGLPRDGDPRAALRDHRRQQDRAEARRPIPSRRPSPGSRRCPGRGGARRSWRTCFAPVACLRISMARRAGVGTRRRARSRGRLRDDPDRADLRVRRPAARGSSGRYFSAEAVLTRTTRSPGRIIPRSASSGRAASVAAPSGDQANRRSRHSSRIVSRIASSETATAQPPVSRMIRKTLICPTFCATFSPWRWSGPAGWG